MIASRRIRMAAAVLFGFTCRYALAQQSPGFGQQAPASPRVVSGPETAEPQNNIDGVVERISNVAPAVIEESSALGESVEVVDSGVVNVAAENGELMALPADAVFREVVVMAGAGRVRVEREQTATRGHAIAAGDDRVETGDGTASGVTETRMVYSNVLGNSVFGPQGVTATSRIADDITTTATAGCMLDRYILRFTGKLLADSADYGPYSVSIELYKACPGTGAGGALIEGTEITIDFPDDGEYSVLVQLPPETEISLPQHFYLGVTFDRPNCGTVVGAPASVGFSADRIDFPGARCSGGFGGFPNGAHASFAARFFVREPCGESFPAYKATNHAGNQYTPGINIFFGQQLRLTQPTCRLTAWEIAHKGNGIILADLRTELSNTDPLNGGLIEGTRGFCFSSGNTAQICRYQPAEPIQLPSSDPYMVFRTTSQVSGPILTCRIPDLGQILYSFPPGSPNCIQSLDITLYCEGQPPVGACCDMALLDSEGEAVCRELPEMNCAFPERWVGGARCGPVCDGGSKDGQSCALDEDCPDGACVGSFCVGGENDGAPCTRAADCPNGSCEGGPFVHACGLAACCRPDHYCANMTRNACLAIEPIESARLYSRRNYCADGEFECPIVACLNRRGECTYSRPEPGCEDSMCCSRVCEEDPFCCFVEWDAECVRATASLCYTFPSTDHCYSSQPTEGAVEIPANGSLAITNYLGSIDPADPGFSCHPDGPGTQGSATSWLSFVATQTSAMIQTCRAEETDVNAIIGVYRATDTSSPQAACASLEEIACGTGAVGCGRGFAARVCAKNLTIGEKYYIQIAARTEDGWGVHEVDILSPCPQTPKHCPPMELEVIDPPSGVVDARDPEAHFYDIILPVVLNAAPGAIDESCWMPCDTKRKAYLSIGRGPEENTDGTITLQLYYFYPVFLAGSMVGFDYYDREGTLTSHYFKLHPADVNADGISNPADILYLIDVLNGVRTAPFGHYSTDCNVSYNNETTPVDILCLIDLFNSTDSAWLNYRFTDKPEDCIQECDREGSSRCSSRAFCKAPPGLCAYRNDDDEMVGVCKWKPVECPGSINPVCGCDGNSYANECFADAAGVSVRHLGACAP
jgi:hypothetical protein